MARSAVPTDYGVPDVLPRETIGPDPYQRIQAPADAFGAGVAQGMEKLGQGALEASSFFGQVAAQDAANRWESEANKILYGDPNVPGDRGFYGKQGRDALDAMPETIQRLTELRSQYKGGLTTPDMQQRFDERTFRVNHYYNEQIGRVYNREFQQFTTATNKASADLALHGIAANAEDQDLVDTNRNRLREAYIKQAQNELGTNLPADVQQSTLAKADAEAVGQQVRAIARRDPIRASQLLEQNRDKLLGPAYDTLRRETDGLSVGWAAGRGAQAAIEGAYQGQTATPGASDGVVRGGSGTGEGHVAPQADRIAFARQYAASKGVNPDAVVATMAGEGLGRYTGDGGTSFGDFQLHVGGGMGDQAVAAGINIRDPRTWQDQTKFAIDQMAANRDKGADWYAGQWHGAPAWAARSFAQPGAETGEAATSPASAAPVAVGDSIAAHLIRFAGVQGKEDRTAVRSYRPGDTAVAGYTPTEILNQVIPAIPADQIKGKPVILSTGASNGPGQLDVIPQQIAALKERGAASVTVLGVGTAPSVAGVNDKLAQIATDNGAAFAGPLQKVAGDGIHSADNADLLRQARGAIPAAGGETATPAATPASAGAVSNSGRSLVDMFAQSDAYIDRLGLTPEAAFTAKLHARSKVREDYNAIEADWSRQQRIEHQVQQQQMQAREAEIWKDAYSDKPQISARQIAIDPAFAGNNERRTQMIALVNNPPGSALPPAQSWSAALSLLDRIRLPDGDPQKITDVGPLYDAAIQGKLNKADFEFVKKELDNVRTPGGEVFNRRKSDFLKAIAPLVDKSNPLMGKIDQSGKMQLYSMEWDLDRRIDEYRQAGKNPADLLDPTKPDFMGKPEALASYQKPLQESLRTLRGQVGAVTGRPPPPAAAPVATAPIPPIAPSAGPPSPATLQPNPFTAPPMPAAPVATAPISPVAPGVPPRQPGETPGDYLKRIGGGLPPVQPAPQVPLR